MIRHHLYSRVALVGLLLSLTQCGQSDPDPRIVEHRQLSGVQVQLDAPSRERFREPPARFLFTLPEGWQELPQVPLRDVNLLVGGIGGAECYVSLLAGTGATLEVINRWRLQMGLSPYAIDGPTDELDNLPTMTLLGKSSLVVDMEGTYQGMGGAAIPDAHMIGLYVKFPMFSASVKFVGPAAVVAQHREEFFEFVRSLRFNPALFSSPPPADSTGRSASPPSDRQGGAVAGEARGGSSDIRYTIPAGWSLASGSSMRLVTLRPEGRSDIECWVTVLPGSAGGTLANLNRWRKEVGERPVTASEVENLPRVTAFGQEWPLLEARGSYQGRSGPAVADALLFGVACELGDFTVFIKMVGPGSDMARERDTFLSFCSSLKG